MSNIKPVFPDGAPVKLLIRREFFLMLFMGLMISVLIAWATVGLIDKPFIIRFCYASAIMVALNITAYMVKTVRHVKKTSKNQGVL
ncbi:hypothetical protein [Klebsiella pneumoniae]|uniref:hypothetical protein n=1 Tax=Klebsiella pneumoniae TaxID=573 RepID=UPI003F6DCA9C